MASRFFLSLVAFSAVLNGLAWAEEPCEGDTCALELCEEKEDLETAQEDSSQKKQRVAFPRTAESKANKESAAAEAAPKKIKPHFAGVKRPPETTSAPVKKTRKIKNEWFSSKTQPKGDKKQGNQVKEEPAELPPDRPYFVKTNYSASPTIFASADPQMRHRENAPTEPEGYYYPRTGFLAPNGHVIVTAEWLYWRTRQEGMEFATSRQIEFDFQSGFRVGLGAHLYSFDGWTIYANYTRFVPDASRSAHGAVYPLFLFQGAGSTGNAVSAAHGHWDVEFQSADLAFGKAYYLTQTLVFSPFFGLKGAWIDQHAHFRYEGGYIPEGQIFRTRFKNDVRGAGPLIGTQMNWQLGLGFCFFGDIATSLVACHFNNKQRQHQLDGLEVVHLDTDFNQVSPFLQMAAGVAWDRNFYRDRCHFGLSLGFEAQQWWNQNQTEQFTDDVRPTYVRQQGDLSFYGLTLKGRFDF